MNGIDIGLIPSFNSGVPLGAPRVFRRGENENVAGDCTFGPVGVSSAGRCVRGLDVGKGDGGAGSASWPPKGDDGLSELLPARRLTEQLHLVTNGGVGYNSSLPSPRVSNGRPLIAIET